MAQNKPRKAVTMIEARKRARLLAAEFAERQQKLLESAEHFLIVQEETDQELAEILARIERLNTEAEAARERVRDRQAQIVRRMSELGAREHEISTRLGLERSDIRRLMAHPGGQTRTPARAGTRPTKWSRVEPAQPDDGALFPTPAQPWPGDDIKA
ncbi:hypothetical protein ACFRKE_00070 [Kitasatospora indigofera]|uniref:hypothetical protein n=1 Tax=Kitasatospora indigofera TaxID=67307 RepID=UPI0036C549D5